MAAVVVVIDIVEAAGQPAYLRVGTYLLSMYLEITVPGLGKVRGGLECERTM